MEELKTAEKVIGFKQSIKLIEENAAKRVYLAEDAEPHVRNPILEMCVAKNIEVVHVPTMEALGKAVEISVGSAVVTIY